MAQSPIFLMLEFARAEQGDDPFAFRFDAQEYLVRSEGGAFKSAIFSWDSQLLAELEELRRPGRGPSLAQRIGQMLRRFLNPTKWAQDEVRLLDAVKEARRVMVSIRSAAAELYALPWELLTVESTGQHVGELPGVLVRYEWPDTRSIPASRLHSAKSRILVAWSGAGGAVPASEHITGLHKANPRESLVFDRTRDVLAHVSCGRLSSALSAATQQEGPVAILHLLAHGSSAGDTSGIALDSDEPGDSAVVVDAGRLRQLLAPHASTLRLVVLAACDSGNSGALGNQLGSIAQALHRAGIAAVVASRHPLSVSGSVRLTESLYAELLSRGSSLESSLLVARLRLAEDAARHDWASLQLYARAEDGADTRPLALTSKLTQHIESQRLRWRFVVVLTGILILLCATGGIRLLLRSRVSDKSSRQESDLLKQPISNIQNPEADFGSEQSPATPIHAAEKLTQEKLPPFRGVVLDKRSKGPLNGLIVTMVGTRCKAETDSYGVFDFEKCNDAGIDRITQPLVRFQSVPGSSKNITCNDIPLQKDRKHITRIELGPNCIYEERRAYGGEIDKLLGL